MDGGWTGMKVAQLAVSMIFWIALPVTFRALRVLRKEVH
ncbi:hypothetical protein SAMN05421869_107335 [Nonomuraea jiangxiensis]|uniref:Uncharacterized protein n=1 Tax=Nonomuraea jiangxiensis TaxID=633440 RepID=A0A1G8P5L8_9ACTN|nr:hypothetical protein SAMN05421869_107335 [Nonomuraea jiangxiensis]